VSNSVKVALVTFALAIGCLAQDTLVTVTSKGREKVASAEVDKIYLSACSAVQREFGSSKAVRPELALVLGADKEGVDLVRKTIFLVKWDRELFAQGVVLLGFQDLLSPQRRMIMARQAVGSADETVNVGEIAK